MLFSITIQITSGLIELLLSKKRINLLFKFLYKFRLIYSTSGCIVNIDVRH